MKVKACLVMRLLQFRCDLECVAQFSFHSIESYQYFDTMTPFQRHCIAKLSPLIQSDSRMSRNRIKLDQKQQTSDCDCLHFQWIALLNQFFHPFDKIQFSRKGSAFSLTTENYWNKIET